ncbi:MAG: thiamine biosynthesis protein ThiF [Hyphomicrobiales bacterium]|nr:MAG: thiamine biosynthesis protein ThiF [Hyphomicrobiales bacterium]
MTAIISPDSLHRLVKLAIDSGAAATVTEAQALFQGFRLAIDFSPDDPSDPVEQATLLTAVALGRRVFLGGVAVTGALDTWGSTPMPLGSALAEAVKALGGKVGGNDAGAPTVVIGRRQDRRDGLAIRTAAAGWRGGLVPAHANLAPEPGPANPLAGMLAAALAINEAFLHVNGAKAAGHRAVGLSLWRPGHDVDWLAGDPSEPALTYLPSKLWLIGLGHLGQAYLWALGLLPYGAPGDVKLVLQDVDAITVSTESTSILTDAAMVGVQKTRAMAAWAERRGFQASIQERLFDADFRRRPDEPVVALCGLDNAAGRRALDQVGFDMIVEAGLGRGHRDFRTLRLHTLPGPRPAADMWKATEAGEKVEDRPAYAKLLADGVLDRCGMTLLAGKAVGAPFVGAVAATFALSEILRLLHGGRVHRLIDLDLLGVEHRTIVAAGDAFAALNPGYTLTGYR